MSNPFATRLRMARAGERRAGLPDAAAIIAAAEAVVAGAAGEQKAATRQRLAKVAAELRATIATLDRPGQRPTRSRAKLLEAAAHTLAASNVVLSDVDGASPELVGAQLRRLVLEAPNERERAAHQQVLDAYLAEAG